MRKKIIIPMLLGLTCLCPSAWSKDLSSELPEVNMRRHHHRHHKSSSHHSHKGATGPRGATGATGPTGPKGNPGATGATAAFIPPSFGSFYSTSIQTVPPFGPIFFENTNSGPIGTAFTFTPGVGPLGEIFTIVEPGFYAISYGVWGQNLVISPDVGIALLLNGSIVPGSDYFPHDTEGDLNMAGLSGIFHLSKGFLQLRNITSETFVISSPFIDGLTKAPVDTSAYINIQFLSPD